uniref:TonB-dependent receptor plug domain-containing protein n=1 Tax=Candidatus Cryptobacteroides bacterium TaxID=3085639 RepID=UPI0040289C36
MKNETIESVCAKLFTPLKISWKINGHYIYLEDVIEPQTRDLKGIVKDESGAGVPGVSVFVEGTTRGTITDSEGRFSLTIRSDQKTARLEFNSLGYEIVHLAIGERTTFNIVLKEESVSLEGTVVTALGIRRDQKALSYNVQEVKADALTDVKNANFVNSLAGKVAGVAINASSSGVGGASKVVLRGNKSISQSSNALYVIDGVPMYNFGGGGGTEFDSKGETESIADLNPEDIQSISVLTGAAAAALYGSQAANGAIMITTKKGESGKLKGSFSSNTEFLAPFVLPKFQNCYGSGLN